MKKILIKAALITLYAFSTMTVSKAYAENDETFSFGTFVNPEGRTFKVDKNGFVIDGRHVLPVMGEIHYSRVPQEDWAREIRKMRAGGITIIATYCFWIHHEPQEGKWDWSGNRNLHRFLQVCKEEQMPVVLRIGPFCHGEVVQGGIPTWLVNKAQSDPKGFKLRSEAPGFINATKRLYANIYAQANDMLWKNGGPVVGVQIENECRGPWSYYMRLKDIAVTTGFDVPFYTRTGWPKLNGKEEFGKLLPLYGDYADGFWDRKLTDMPSEYQKAFIMKDNRMSEAIATETFNAAELKEDAKTKTNIYPYLTCELGGGMMPCYHRRINMSGCEAMPLVICKLGSGSNLPGYYMYHGGTNPSVDEYTIGNYNPIGQETMGETQNTAVTNYNDMPYMTYDFQCPLGEMGQPLLTAFHQTRWLHQFLNDWGEELSQMPSQILSEHHARRGCFEFYNDYVRILNENGTAYVRPIDMPYMGHIISADMQPFCKATNGLYFITIRGHKPTITVDGKKYSMKAGKTINAKGIDITLLTEEQARKAYVINGQVMFANNDGGILYKGDGHIFEEYWAEDAVATQSIKYTITKKANSLRKVTLGTQKVAAMPKNADFENAQTWLIELPENTDEANSFLSINYAGDCARIYADGQLVEDNFWNGKTMLVRMNSLKGKKIELRIMPLSKDAPIYLQEKQKKELQQSNNNLLELKDIKVIRRTTTQLN